MTVEVGDLLPGLVLPILDAEGGWSSLDTGREFAAKRAVVFGLPGAFTPTCSTMHLPGYVAQAAAFADAGVDLLACLTVNDPFVVRAWAKDLDPEGKVVMLPDGNGDLTRALGLQMDGRVRGMGIRTQRCAMVLNDRRVEHLFVEKDGEYRVSDALYVLRHL